MVLSGAFFLLKARAAVLQSLGFLICWDDVHIRQLLDLVWDLALLQISQVHHINDVFPEMALAGVGFVAQTHTATSSHTSQACDF